MKGLFITVDAPQLGRREKDMRLKIIGEDSGAKVQEGQKNVPKDQGVARAISVGLLRSALSRPQLTHPLGLHRPKPLLG